MKVDHNLVDKISELARLEFDSDSKEEIVSNMNRMLAFVEKLNEVNTENVEPLIYLSDETNILREDISVTTITQKEALLNAPQHDSDYFKVPKVIEKK